MMDFRSKSCRDGRMMRTESYSYYGNRPAGPPTGMRDLRSYSTNSYAAPKLPPAQLDKELKIKKGKVNNGIGSPSSKNWSLMNDPEFQRKKRVASYKAYAVEGKMKGSFKKSFRWIKDTCNQVVHGWW
ncbi:uncharacterized protein LOC131310661 [Rhododendron vialii]|uniref:DUF3511 domain protein n=2 Tax=Rhododendron TaxID=4346 RepID=A0AAV6I4X7_9ERIC